MYLLAIMFPIGIRKILASLQKIAIINLLNTGCLMSIFAVFILDKSRQGRANYFNWSALLPTPPGFVAQRRIQKGARAPVRF